MKGKLKSNLIIMEIVFLLIVVGGSALVYSVFAAPYYTRIKSGIVKEAYEDCREMDMANLGQDDFQTLERYEEEHFSFTISDEFFCPVYTTDRKDPEGVVRRNILINLDKYSDNPQFINRNTRSAEGIRLRGIFYQDSVKYYICIRETSGSSYSAFFYTERFLLVVVIVALLLGSLFMYMQGRRIARPIERMASVSQKLADHDFSARVTEETTYEEVNVLARNFNNMADQIQYYIQELECRNEKLQEQNEQKEKMERMRREFSANVSHELKTPLAVISSQLEMLQLVGEEERKYYFDSIHEEIEKMSDLIRNLLRISAAEHELGELDKQRVDLAEVLEYLILKYDALFRQKEIKRICSMGQGSVVWADKSCMEQAMSNYMLNAFSHTGTGGQIRISLFESEGNVFFRVYNEGEQIQEQEKERIWINYYQGEPRENHAGLGLYIVKTIVMLHGGTYGVTNRERGVEFWFSLPVYEEKMDKANP